MCSLLRGKALQIVRQVDRQRGYEAIRLLLLTYQPPSKVRSLGVLSALTQVKSFDPKQQTLPQLLELERAFDEYEKSSGEQIQESLKSALLLRSVSNSVRAHISASLDESASYAILRECILRLERVQFKWNSTNVFASDTGLFGGRGKGSDQPYSDAVPMEVDRIKGKGKGKQQKGKGGKHGKGDGKGKGKAQFQGGKDKSKQQKGKQQHQQQSQPGAQTFQDIMPETAGGARCVRAASAASAGCAELSFHVCSFFRLRT